MNSSQTTDKKEKRANLEVSRQSMSGDPMQKQVVSSAGATQLAQAYSSTEPIDINLQVR